MRAFVADVAGDTPRAIELARRAEELLPPSEGVLRMLVPYILGKAYRYQGDLERSEAYTSQQIRISRAANNIWPLSGALHELIWLRRMQGRLRDVARILDEFEALPREPGSDGPVAKVIADRGELERERGDLAAAARAMQTALESVGRWGLPSDMFFCYMTRCRLLLSTGQPDLAAEDVARADETTRKSLVYASMFPLLEAERARVLVARGMLAEALAWLESYRFPDDGSPVNREVVLIARARVLQAAGRRAEALELLDRLAADAQAGGRGGRLLEIRVLQACSAAADEQADSAAAHAFLHQALALAEPEGYVRVFLDEGEPMVGLLRQCDHSPKDLPPALAAYARRLIALNAG